jgi:hypothetical protein
MNTDKLQALIDRAIGKKGILRIPTWWMNKILSELLNKTEDSIPLQHQFSDEFNNDFSI